MDFESFENWVGDYESSFAASQLPSGVRDHLGSLLQAFLAGVRQHAPDFPEAMPSGTFAKALEHPLALQVPASARRFAAEAVAGFFEYLQTSGRLAEGDAWATQIRIIGRDIGGRIREDGTTRGVTRQRAAAAIGRNDPCPCGSGKKYKKCCGG